MQRRALLAAAVGAAATWPFRAAFAADGTRPSLPAEIASRGLDGRTIALARADVDALGRGLRGTLLLPESAGYDAARRVWNGMFDRRPALIARCAAPSDVMLAVDFARTTGVLTAVRGGGHSATGKSTCDGGLVIDLSPMQAVRVDPAARIARVEGGALLGHLDRETRAHRLVTTAGTVSHTGAGGLTLGGGYGRVCRRFGLACDNVRAFDLVTADGRLRTVGRGREPELDWALRGGGGNFGVATSFEYELHPMDPTVLAGTIAWPAAAAREALRFFAEYSATAPDELNLDAVAFWNRGVQMFGVDACWSADPVAGERVLRPLREFGRPAFDGIRAMPYVELQQSTDAIAAHGRRFYAKAGFLRTLDERTVDRIADAIASAPAGAFNVNLQHGGGAVARVSPDATAFPNRRTQYWMMLLAVWDEPAQDEARTGAVRAAWRSLEPLIDGFYVNTMSEEQYSRVDSNYGANYARLARVKAQYDPGNLFRLNANVRPAA